MAVFDKGKGMVISDGPKETLCFCWANLGIIFPIDNHIFRETSYQGLFQKVSEFLSLMLTTICFFTGRVASSLQVCSEVLGFGGQVKLQDSFVKDANFQCH